MRCLFVMEDHPISPDAPGGGPVLMYSRLELMAHSPLEVHLLILRDSYESHGFREYVENQPEIWAKVRSWCASHQLIDLVHRKREAARLRRLRRLMLALFDPISYLFSNVNEETISAFMEVVSRVEPDLIWAENLVPAALAFRAKGKVPLVYSHHDWISRLLKIRYRVSGTLTWRLRFELWLLERVERSLIRRAAACLSASATEAAQLREMSSGAVAFLPIAYSPANSPDDRKPEVPPRVVHVGGMGTVANRVGLLRFLQVAWPIIRRRSTAEPELWIVGSMENAPAPLLAAIAEAQAVVTGFVQELGSVLRPYDINVVPWEHNTGTRTKIPLMLNHAQVVVSTRAAAACLPEIGDGRDCVLVNELEQMGGVVVELLGDPKRRARIGRSGRKTFLTHFTRDALQPRFDQFLRECPRPPGQANSQTRSSRSSRRRKSQDGHEHTPLLGSAGAGSVGSYDVESARFAVVDQAERGRDKIVQSRE